jgi:putative transcriptional regulator
MTNQIDVKTTRTTLGLTQMQLAAQMGVDQTTISNWECGKSLPKGPARIILAQIASIGRSQ